MRILFPLISMDRVKDRPSCPEGSDLAIAKGFLAHGCEIHYCLTADSNPPKDFKPDFVFFTKIREVPSWLFRMNVPTVCFLGDWRPDNHKPFKKFEPTTYMFRQHVCEGAQFLPAPIWCDDFTPNRKRPHDWLWAGQKSGGGIFDTHRNEDVKFLPPGTPLYAITHAPLREWEFVKATETHKWGLSVSHRNDVPKYSSSRLGYFQAGGMTCAVRWFPGCEELVAPGQFVYKTTEELKEFVKDPYRLDPVEVHEFARSVYDTRLFAKKVLETVACSL